MRSDIRALHRVGERLLKHLINEARHERQLEQQQQTLPVQIHDDRLSAKP
jgi:hypothetical protein